MPESNITWVVRYFTNVPFNQFSVNFEELLRDSINDVNADVFAGNGSIYLSNNSSWVYPRYPQSETSLEYFLEIPRDLALGDFAYREMISGKLRDIVRGKLVEKGRFQQKGGTTSCRLQILELLASCWLI